MFSEMLREQNAGVVATGRGASPGAVDDINVITGITIAHERVICYDTYRAALLPVLACNPARYECLSAYCGDGEDLSPSLTR